MAGGKLIYTSILFKKRLYKKYGSGLQISSQLNRRTILQYIFKETSASKRKTIH